MQEVIEQALAIVRAEAVVRIAEREAEQRGDRQPAGRPEVRLIPASELAGKVLPKRLKPQRRWAVAVALRITFEDFEAIVQASQREPFPGDVAAFWEVAFDGLRLGDGRQVIA